MNKINEVLAALSLWHRQGNTKEWLAPHLKADFQCRGVLIQMLTDILQ